MKALISSIRSRDSLHKEYKENTTIEKVTAIKQYRTRLTEIIEQTKQKLRKCIKEIREKMENNSLSTIKNQSL